MKRIIILFIFIFLLIACKKKRTCSCEHTITTTSAKGVQSTPYTTHSLTEYESAKKSVVDDCGNRTTSVTHNSVVTTTQDRCVIED